MIARRTSSTSTLSMSSTRSYSSGFDLIHRPILSSKVSSADAAAASASRGRGRFPPPPPRGGVRRAGTSSSSSSSSSSSLDDTTDTSTGVVAIVVVVVARPSRARSGGGGGEEEEDGDGDGARVAATATADCRRRASSGEMRSTTSLAAARGCGRGLGGVSAIAPSDGHAVRRPVASSLASSFAGGWTEWEGQSSAFVHSFNTPKGRGRHDAARAHHSNPAALSTALWTSSSVPPRARRDLRPQRGRRDRRHRGARRSI